MRGAETVRYCKGMPKRKITPELWAQVTEAYRQWTPGERGAGTIDELLRPFGISKQAFYAERRRLGLPGKSAPTEAVDGNVVKVILDALVECRLKNAELMHELMELRSHLV